LSPRVNKILLRGCLGLLGAVVVAYAVDAVQVRIRLAIGGSSKACDTVTILYAAALKDGKYEIFSDRPVRESCSRSLFPQLGYAPCWYLRQRSIQVID
jgi:hypothetical protein